MQRRTFLTLGLAGTAGLALAGCGFRLRGFDDPSPVLDELALAGPDGELSRLARERLEAAGTRVQEGAALRLNLGETEIRRRGLSVLDSGPRDEEMTLVAPFSVQRARDGAYLLDQQRLEVSTRYTVSDADLLNQEELREEARRELLDAAVRQLLDRLRAL
ncbi:LPS assembly lipoprotein LptE [Halomonas sp. Y3]|uniref:LPS-assembly lipoprotein LptE n=1 Tax=Halomonas sp. Y3 TaxID=2956797 RepID=UPI00209CC050|nr:LPS assembly lipoprotein LptE [Halomonas sp. Y3]